MSDCAERTNLVNVKEQLKIPTEEEKEKMRKFTCFACQGHIEDEYIMRVADRSWHARCLVCHECGCHLTNTCYFKSGRLYCPQHPQHSLVHCSGCDEPINQSELIQRSIDSLYHISCFHCISCGRQFEKGDDYYMLEDTGKLMCKDDYETAQRKDYEGGNKRPRTTISSKQLDALKKAYKKTCKPARHVREALAKQTGLDSRVVQVWFQNRRAKEKRVTKDYKGVDNSGYGCSEDTPYMHHQCQPAAHPTWLPLLPVPDQQLFSQAANTEDAQPGRFLPIYNFSISY